LEKLRELLTHWRSEPGVPGRFRSVVLFTSCTSLSVRDWRLGAGTT